MADDGPLARAVLAARHALDQVDPEQPTTALPLLREAGERLSEATDAAMAAVILEEGGSIRMAGSLAGLSENAVGPRLARTEHLAAYSSETGRVTARGVERALYDIERGVHAKPDADAPPPPMRFKARRPK